MDDFSPTENGAGSSGSAGTSNLSGARKALAVAEAANTSLEQANGALRARETELRELREQLEAVVAHSGIGIGQVDLSGRFVLVNDRQCEILCRSRDELIGLRMIDLTHPEDRPWNQELIRHMLETGESFALEKRYLRPDGSDVWVQNHVSLARDAVGRPRYITALVRDVTAERSAAADRQALLRQVEAERARAEAGRARLAAVLEHLPVGVGITDRTGRVILSNRALRRFVGDVVPSVDPGLHASWIAHGPDGSQVGGENYAVACALRGEAVTPGIEFLHRPDGGQGHWTRIAAVPVREKEGDEVAGAVLLVQDTDAQKRAAERLSALVELGDRLQALHDPVGIAFTAAEIVGRTLGADRAGYGAVDEAVETITIERDWAGAALPNLTGRFHLQDYWTGFVAALRRGEVVTTGDVLNDPQIGDRAENFVTMGVRAALHAPSRDGGRVTAVLYVHSATPRHWTEEEAAFVRGVAERAWAAAERARSEWRQELMLLELNHRVKNILATVQGMASATLKGTGGDPQRFAKHFGERLRTLARAHDMLTSRQWEPAGVETTLRAALAPWLETTRAVQLAISGAARATAVSPRQAQSLVLAFHELATNATKYGALSSPAGRVSIDCATGPSGSVEIHWTELGGPAVVRPANRRGFGTRLLERGLARDLGSGSRVELRFEPAGLRASILFTPDNAPRWATATLA
ncbi:PAS domain S-box protein [Roseomonas sp. SSH11]|uniref:histidine kinase n=1 Tax=Pararoseomonas baculiformis TaxID=2820812 RepID=A0ABS4AJN7_9PROT|nr:PAS domain S-box protein [Pararoseomonas baculiformis]MBP0447257.1 PAS domain S-box protein [Pararoseomonas baculiformis]